MSGHLALLLAAVALLAFGGGIVAGAVIYMVWPERARAAVERMQRRQ